MKNFEQNNTDLTSARKNKADEFYTAYEDIASEMSLYKSDFKDKVVYCPCDDSNTSNFFKYFKDNFTNFGLKKLIATCFNREDYGSMTIIENDSEKTVQMKSNGDFRSDECKSILSESDIVVTNPPFSLFREFIDLLNKTNILYIILGNINAVTYREVFQHIISHKITLGGSIHSGDREFRVPDDYPLDGIACRTADDGTKFIRVKGVRWFTNMDYQHPGVRHTVLTAKYSPESYSKFDTYDAINVNTMKEIPVDYDAVMGVPITVIDKLNKDKLCEFKDENGNILLFSIIGQLNSGNGQNYDFAKPIINGKCKFKRLLIIKERV